MTKEVRELDTLLGRIEDLRGQLIELVRGLPKEALNWRPIDGSNLHETNSIAVLATHVAGAEHFWIGEVVGGLPATRVRDEEFRAEVKSAQQLIDLLESTGRETGEIMAGLSPAHLKEWRQVRGRNVSVLWSIIHVIDHTALHLGHIQLTVQLWNSGQAGPSPRWYQRLQDGD